MGEEFTATIESAFLLPSFSPVLPIRLDNRLHIEDGACIQSSNGLPFNSLGNASITTTGGDIISIEVSDAPCSEPFSGGEIVITFLPSSSELTFTIEWEAVDDYVPPFLGITQERRHYIGGFTLDVISPNTPTLTKTSPVENIIPIGTAVNLTLRQTFSYQNGTTKSGEILKQECGGDYESFDIIGFGGIQPSGFGRADSYFNESSIGEKFYRGRTYENGCASPLSNVVAYEVQYVTPQNPCSDNTDINVIEQAIDDALNQSVLPSDYHRYQTPNSRIESDCTLEEVWSSYIGSNRFAQPQAYDMPTEFISYIPSVGKFIDTNIPLPPTTNCENYEITSVTNTIGKLAPHILALYGQGAPLAAILADCPDFLTVNSFFDPIKIVVDDDAKCITRYTLPGHVFYPGKTTTCFTVDTCGDVYVQTTGEGRTVCGESIGGAGLKEVNIHLGLLIFENNHARINCN